MFLLSPPTKSQSFVSSLKPFVIKLIVEIKVLTGLNIIEVKTSIHLLVQCSYVHAFDSNRIFSKIPFLSLILIWSRKIGL